MDQFDIMLSSSQIMEYGISTLHVMLTAIFVSTLIFSNHLGKRLLFLTFFTLCLLTVADVYFVIDNRIETIYLSRSVFSFCFLGISFLAVNLIRRFTFKRRPFKYV